MNPLNTHLLVLLSHSHHYILFSETLWSGILFAAKTQPIMLLGAYSIGGMPVFVENGAQRCFAALLVKLETEKLASVKNAGEINAEMCTYWSFLPE